VHPCTGLRTARVARNCARKGLRAAHAGACVSSVHAPPPRPTSGCCAPCAAETLQSRGYSASACRPLFQVLQVGPAGPAPTADHFRRPEAAQLRVHRRRQHSALTLIHPSHHTDGNQSAKAAHSPFPTLIPVLSIPDPNRSPPCPERRGALRRRIGTRSFQGVVRATLSSDATRGRFAASPRAAHLHVAAHRKGGAQGQPERRRQRSCESVAPFSCPAPPLLQPTLVRTWKAKCSKPTPVRGEAIGS